MRSLTRRATRNAAPSARPWCRRGTAAETQVPLRPLFASHPSYDLDPAVIARAGVHIQVPDQGVCGDWRPRPSTHARRTCKRTCRPMISHRITLQWQSSSIRGSKAISGAVGRMVNNWAGQGPAWERNKARDAGSRA